MFCLCLGSFLHIFLNLCNFIFSFKLCLFFIYLSVHHLFFIIYLIIIIITRSTQRAHIITPILSTVKMLSLGCEILPTPLKKKKKKKKKKRFWIITFTTIWVCYHYYGVFVLIYSSYNTQITTKI